MEVFLGRGAAIFFKGETLIQIPAVGFGSDLVWRWHALERRKKNWVWGYSSTQRKLVAIESTFNPGFKSELSGWRDNRPRLSQVPLELLLCWKLLKCSPSDQNSRPFTAEWKAWSVAKTIKKSPRTVSWQLCIAPGAASHCLFIAALAFKVHPHCSLS